MRGSWLFDYRWHDRSGIGRFTRELRARLPEFEDLPISGSPTHPLDAIRLAGVLKQQRASLFLSPGFNVPVRASCPVLCTIHDLIHIHFPGESSLGKRAYYRFVQKPMVRRSPLVFTVSEFSRREICEWYGLPDDRVVCVGNGVSSLFSPDGPPADVDRPFVLYVGNARPHKNVETLIHAFARLPMRDDLRLILVSDGNDALNRLIDHLGLHDHVIFRRQVTDADLAALYRSAAMTVLPSFFEGFGLPMVEAMASGSPVIGSNRTSLPEIIGDAGLIVDPTDQEAFTHSMTKLLESDSLRSELKSKGLLRAAAFSWDRVGDRARRALQPFMS